MSSDPLPNESAPGVAGQIVAGWEQLGRKIRASQLRSELRRVDQHIARLRTELAQGLLSSPDLPEEVPLTPKLSDVRHELLRIGDELEGVRAARDAEIERARLLEEERGAGLAPLGEMLESAQKEREELRRKEEWAAREGLDIARRRDLLDRELSAAPSEKEEELQALRRRHAVEELEALERRASRLTAEREQLAREAAAADRRLVAAKDGWSERAAGWDAPLAEARAHRKESESKISALERRGRAAFLEVAAEAAAWAEAWRSVAGSADDPAARKLVAELEELEAERSRLGARLGGATPEKGGGNAGEFAGGGPILAVAFVALGVVFVASVAIVAALWFWLGDRSAPAAPTPQAASVAAAKIRVVPLEDLLRGLASEGCVLRSEPIVAAPAGALEASRIYPFADEAGVVEIYAYSSVDQARDARRRMGRLLPDPRDTLLTENSEQVGRFVMWGLAQFEARSRSRLKAALRLAVEGRS
jgi:hypothetical protein